jgi:GR25 family glycosyltransferase involved in LPS biosynthesis
MRCFYINLDRASARREALESRFAECAPSGWSLTRVPAVGPDEAGAHGGTLAPLGAKGCYLSHVRALEMALDVSGDVFILEDDATFSRRSLEALAHLLASPDWELFFADLSICHVAKYVNFIRQWGDLTANGRFLIEDLAGINFVGSSAYVVRESAKRRLHDLISSPAPETPIDLKLCKLIRDGRLRASYCVPHLTSLSPEAESSQIASEEPLLYPSLRALRRLLYIDHDLEACAADGAKLAARVDPHVALCCDALAAILVS